MFAKYLRIHTRNAGLYESEVDAALAAFPEGYNIRVLTPYFAITQAAIWATMLTSNTS